MAKNIKNPNKDERVIQSQDSWYYNFLTGKPYAFDFTITDDKKLHSTHLNAVCNQHGAELRA